MYASKTTLLINGALFKFAPLDPVSPFDSSPLFLHVLHAPFNNISVSFGWSESFQKRNLLIERTPIIIDYTSNILPSHHDRVSRVALVTVLFSILFVSVRRAEKAVVG